MVPPSLMFTSSQNGAMSGRSSSVGKATGEKFVNFSWNERIPFVFTYIEDKIKDWHVAMDVGLAGANIHRGWSHLLHRKWMLGLEVFVENCHHPEWGLLCHPLHFQMDRSTLALQVIVHCFIISAFTIHTSRSTVTTTKTTNLSTTIKIQLSLQGAWEFGS